MVGIRWPLAVVAVESWPIEKVFPLLSCTSHIDVRFVSPAVVLSGSNRSAVTGLVFHGLQHAWASSGLLLWRVQLSMCLSVWESGTWYCLVEVRFSVDCDNVTIFVHLCKDQADRLKVEAGFVILFVWSWVIIPLYADCWTARINAARAFFMSELVIWVSSSGPFLVGWWTSWQ